MAELTEERLKADKRLRNIKPWKKGEAPRVKSTGRPKIKRFIDAIQNHYETGPSANYNMKQLVKALQKKTPQEIAHYLAGKPVERIDLSGELKHTVDPSIVAAAQVAIGKL